ncbi:MAG: hypothetical protein DRQ88_04230 [Epsilonproteobacteria bacterium]|nr:MAG: hypothetical protein DRQ89_00490 [Campylobacterota bacterium]RLA67108.1 MAG: hypothetical protein DRQ88_04230 [Campylobacterota bacterium]
MKIPSNRPKALNYKKEQGPNNQVGKKTKEIKSEAHQQDQNKNVLKNNKWDHLINHLNEKKGIWKKEISFLETKHKTGTNHLKEKDTGTSDIKVIQHNKSKDTEKNLRVQKKRHQETIRDIDNKYYAEIKMRQELQKNNIEKINQDHNEIMRDREVILKDKINGMERSHQETLYRLKTKNTNDINDLKKSYAREKDNIAIKARDPFYNLTMLNPRIKERKEDYILSLEIPEHEIKFVNLTGKNKKLRLTTSRNFKDLAQTEKGAFNRSARSEMVSQEYMLENHINPRKISQIYEDGMLIFKVPKN